MTWRFSRNTLLLLGGMSAISFAFGFAIPNYPLYVELLGASSSEFGLLVFVKMATLVTVMVPGGWFTDNFGPKYSLLIAGFTDFGSWLILSVAPTWHWVGIYSVLSGAAWGFTTGAWYVILANENPTREGTPNISAFAIGMLAHILPDAGGSLLGVGYFKLSGDIYSQSVLCTTFKLGAVFSLLELGFYALIRTPTQIENTDPKTGSFSDFFSKTTIGFLGFSLSNLFIGLGTGMIFDFFPLYFVERFQVTPSVNSLLRFFSSLTIVGATLAVPIVSQKLGKVEIVYWTQSLVLPPVVLLALERKRLWLATVAYLARGMFISMAYPAVASITMSILDEENRGKGGSLWDFFWSGGYLIAPPISGRLIQAQGFATSFYIASVCYGFSTLIFYFAARRSLSSQAMKPPPSIPVSEAWHPTKDKY